MNVYYKTNQLAAAGGVSVQYVRNLEHEGFLPAVERSATGYRLWSAQHLAALQTCIPLIQSYGRQRVQKIMQAIHGNDLATALALIDTYHGELAAQRIEMAETLHTLQTLAAAPAPSKRARHMLIHEAAELVHTTTATLRFWQEQGLLEPQRTSSSGYRSYAPDDQRRIHIISLLRQADYPIPAIRNILHDLERHDPEQTIVAIEDRRTRISEQSWNCIQALVLLHAYIQTYAHTPI